MEEIPNNHLGCIKPCRYWDKLPTSTGDRRISSINNTNIPFWEDVPLSDYVLSHHCPQKNHQQDFFFPFFRFRNSAFSLLGSGVRLGRCSSLWTSAAGQRSFQERWGPEKAQQEQENGEEVTWHIWGSGQRQKKRDIKIHIVNMDDTFSVWYKHNYQERKDV